MNVTVSEYSEGELQDRYNVFVDLYNNTKLKLYEIANHMDISLPLLNRLRKEAEKNGDISRLPQRSEYDYFYKCNDGSGKYVVLKKIDGKMIYFGRYGSEDEAKKIVEELKKVDWDKSQLKRIKEWVKL